MKKIETTNIAALAGAPFIKATHDHINESRAEVTSAIIKGLLGTYTTNDIIILHGCTVTANIPGTSSVTAGAIYYNGEIYEVDANASISSPSDTLVWSIATTYRAGDPIQWADGNSRNLHRIDKFQLTNAVSGSGLADYNGATVKTYKRTIQETVSVNEKIVEITNWDMDTNATKSVAHGFADITKIRGFSVMIRNDAGTIVSFIQGDIDNNGASDAYINYIDTTNIAMTRVAAGAYDAASYNGTGTRGWITFKYVD